MNWKFWKKKKPEPLLREANEAGIPTDLYEFSVFVGALYARNVFPFDDWREPAIDVPTHLNSAFQRVAQIFQVTAWLSLVYTKYGVEATRLAQDVFCLQAAREGASPDARTLSNFVSDAVTATGRAGRAAANDENQKGGLPWTHFAAIDMLVGIAEQPYNNKTDNEFDGNEALLGRCIAHASDRARVNFDGLLRNVRYTPDAFVEWLWSTHPGGHEMHLHRRWNNPLFSSSQRKVTATDVYHAWIKDGEALEALKVRVENLLGILGKCGGISAGNHEMLTKVNDLIAEYYKIGGDPVVLDVLQEARRHVYAWWRQGIGGNLEKMRALELAEQKWNEFEYLDNVFVQQVINPEYIPFEELVPALLSEPVENIRAYCKYLVSMNNDDPIPTLRIVALSLVRERQCSALDFYDKIPDWQDRLDAIANA